MASLLLAEDKLEEIQAVLDGIAGGAAPGNITAGKLRSLAVHESKIHGAFESTRRPPRHRREASFDGVAVLVLDQSIQSSRPRCLRELTL